MIQVWEEALSQIGANGLGQLEIEISTESVEVEKIGVRSEHEQDIEDSNQTMTQCSTTEAHSMRFWVFSIMILII